MDTTWMIEGLSCWVNLENQLQKTQKKDAKDIQNENIYQRGKIIKLDQNKKVADVQYESDKTTYEVKFADMEECNQDPKIQYEDMVDMAVLNEPEILANIKKYYKEDNIFTKIGPTLIVMNPYKYIPELFSDDIFETIRADSQKPNFDFSQALPHVWSIAANAYSQLFTEQKNQAIIISGESGAGKTENTKFAMKFLTSLSENKNCFVISEAEQESSIEEKILRCNPILEAFGNAKTVKNDNSSRFGKYVRIWMDKDSRKIQGANINKYLLEKSRVTHLGLGERNYHIFYMFMKGCKDLSQYNLENIPENYSYLNSDCINVAGIKDLELYEEMIASFNKLGFSKDEQKTIFDIVAAVIHLGNIQFDEKSFSDQNPCTITNLDRVEYAANLLKVKKDDLAKSITFKMRIIGKQVIESPISKEECLITRDTLSKALFDKIFDWLCQKLNLGIQPEIESESNLSLGLLDIFGFENFEINSFEQVCINFTNEKLQQLYIEYVFKSEEKEFIAEGLQDKLMNLVFKDNTEVINLLDQKRIGIFELLDESSSLGNATDAQLLSKIQSNNEKNQCLKKEKIKSQSKFSIIHTAKEVEYTIDGFRQKNKDEIVVSLQQTIDATQNKIISNIWKNQLFDSPDDSVDQSVIKRKGKSDKYLGAKFRQQMNQLMEQLQSCGAHFIRCLKPNEVKNKGLFLQTYVMQQIRYLGVLESVKVRKEGFPFRMQHKQFYEKYRELSKKYQNIPVSKYTGDDKKLIEACKSIIEMIFQNFKGNKVDTILFGNSKIYMRFEPSQFIGETLQKWWKKKEEILKKIQKQVRRFLYRKKILGKLKLISKLVQKFIRVVATQKMRIQRKKFLVYIGAKNGTNLMEKIKLRFLRKALKKLESQIQCLKLGEQQRNEYLKQQEQLRQEQILKEKQEKQAQQEIEQQKKQKEIEEKQQQYIQQKQQKQQQEQKELQQQQKQNNNNEQIQQAKEETQEQNQQINTENANQQIKKNIVDDFYQYEKALPLWKEDMIGREQNIIDFQLDSKLQTFTGLDDQPLSKKRMSKIPTFVEVAESKQSSADTIQPADYLETFIKAVKAKNYLEFCENFIVKGQNFSKSAKIQKMMSFQKDSLKEPLSRCADYAREADIIFRCILKIGGNRRSRFPLVFQQSNCISLCLGNDTLDGQEEAKNYTSSRMSQKQQSYGKNLAKKFSSNVLVTSDKSNINPQQVILRMIGQVMSEKWLPLRDELFFQVCKQIEGNSSDGTKKLYKFFSLCLNVFSPSFQVILPLLNFFLNKFDTEKHQDNKKEARYIFNKLAKILQSYYIISEIQFVISNDLIDLSIFLKNDPVNEQISKNNIGQPIPFYVMEHHISVVSARTVLPIQEEQKQISERQDSIVVIHLFDSEQETLKLPCPSYKTVYQIKNEACEMLGIQDVQHNYGLYQIKFIQDKISEETYLSDREKILDVMCSQKNEIDFNFQTNKKLQKINIYLKLRVSYPFTVKDKDTITMQYFQNQFDFKRCKFNVSTTDIMELASCEVYVRFGQKSKEGIDFIQNNVQQLLPDKQRQEIMSIDKFKEKILVQYKALEFQSRSQAQFSYLNILRKQDIFMGQQFFGKEYTVLQTPEGYAKSKEPSNCTIIFKPMYIVLQSPDKKTSNVIEIEKIASWGRSQGSVSCYFYIKLVSGELYIFALKNLVWPDFYINVYSNYLRDSETYGKYKCRYNDVVAYLLNQNDEYEENKEDE